jgi:RNA polymerase sigma-70 factor (ECF subfamily)
MEQPTDETLLARIGREDGEAMALFYDRNGSVSYSLAYRILGDRAFAEDVVQEAFLSVWRMATTFNGHRGSARTCLMSVVHHRAIDREDPGEITRPHGPMVATVSLGP